MPYTRTWMRRVDEVYQRLDDCRKLFLDRRDIEDLFDVRRSAAVELMKAIGATSQIGQNLVVEKRALVSFVFRAKNDPAYFKEKIRRQDLEQRLAADRTEILARRRVIRAPSDAAEKTLATLPNVKIGQGKLTVEFFGAEDLLLQLYQLSQAIANDWAQFEQAAES